MLGLGVANNVGDCGSGMDGAKVVGEGMDGIVKADCNNNDQYESTILRYIIQRISNGNFDLKSFYETSKK